MEQDLFLNCWRRAACIRKRNLRFRLFGLILFLAVSLVFANPSGFSQDWASGGTLKGLTKTADAQMIKEAANEITKEAAKENSKEEFKEVARKVAKETRKNLLRDIVKQVVRESVR